MISIIIPAHNEEERISQTLEEYLKFFKTLKKKRILNFEIIVVLNNCYDNTLGIVKKFAKRNKELGYLDFKEKGKGFAITTGFRDALKRKNDLIGFVDADMSSLPDAFYELIKNINNYDGIIASRQIKGAKIKKSLKRTAISFTFNFIVRALFFLHYKDTQCGCKLFTRKALESVIGELSERGWIFDIDILYKLKKKGFVIKEMPTTWEDKKGSKIEGFFRTSLKMFWQLIKLKIKSISKRKIYFVL